MLALRRLWGPPRQPGPTRRSSRSGSTTATAAAVRALDRGARLRAVVGGREAGGLRAALGASGTACRASASRAGPAARWPRSSSPGSAARPCSAPPTPSWRRRWRRSTPAPRSSSSTATARTSACPSRTSRRKAERHRPRAAILVHIGGHIAFDAERIAAYCRDERHLPARGLRPRPRRRLERPPAGRLRRRRRLLALRDEDGLHRRGRRARLRRPRPDRVRRASSATTASSSTRSTASTSG